MYVVLKCNLPPSTLKKKHNVIAYHCVMESIYTCVVKLSHVRLDHNYACLITKSRIGSNHYALYKPLKFNPMIEIKAFN